MLKLRRRLECGVREKIWAASLRTITFYRQSAEQSSLKLNVQRRSRDPRVARLSVCARFCCNSPAPTRRLELRDGFCGYSLAPARRCFVRHRWSRIWSKSNGLGVGFDGRSEVTVFAAVHHAGGLALSVTMDTEREKTSANCCPYVRGSRGVRKHRDPRRRISFRLMAVFFSASPRDVFCLGIAVFFGSLRHDDSRHCENRTSFFVDLWSCCHRHHLLCGHAHRDGYVALAVMLHGVGAPPTLVSSSNGARFLACRT